MTTTATPPADPPPPILMPYDFSDPKQHMAMLLTSMPNPNAASGRIAVPTKAIPEWSRDGWRLGYRHHPEFQELWPIPGEQIGMGWLNPVRLVNRKEYEKWLNQAQDKVTSLLTQIMGPQNRAMFEGMSDAEKADLLEKQRYHIKRSIAQMQALEEEIDATIADEVGD